MKTQLFGLLTAFVAVAGFASEMHVVTFLPPEQLKKVQTELNKSVPALWSDAGLWAEGDEETLIVDLRLAPALGSKDFEAVCQTAAKAVATSLDPGIPRTIRIIREWRILHAC